MSDPVVLLSTGDVVGPAGGVTNNSMVLFSGTSGKLIKGNNAVVTAAGLALLDDVDAGAQLTTLGLTTTHPQFDATTNQATTEFVQRALGSASGQVNYNVATTLTAADAGKIVIVGGGAPITLPLASTVAAGTTITIIASPSACVVQKQGSDSLNSLSSSAGPFTLVANSRAVFRRLLSGDGWSLDDGDFSLKYSPMFGSLLAGSGYKKIPDANSPTGFVILQWGYIAAGSTDITTTLPVAYPNQILYAISSSAYTPGTGTIGYVAIGWNPGSKTAIVTRASNVGLGPVFLTVGY